MVSGSPRMRARASASSAASSRSTRRGVSRIVIADFSLTMEKHRLDQTRGMADMGRLLVILGIALVVIGSIVMLLGRTGVPLGRLPGDIVYRGKNTTFYFPLASSILISVVLTIVLFLIGRVKR